MDPRHEWTKIVRGTEVKMDNRWVVPYNPFLLRKYKALINVEVCSSMKAIKHVHKSYSMRT